MLKDRHAIIGDGRGGRGLMPAIERVADRTTRAAPDTAQPGRVEAGACAAGAMVRVSAPNIILSPPPILSEADAQIILDAREAGVRGL